MKKCNRCKKYCDDDKFISAKGKETSTCKGCRESRYNYKKNKRKSVKDGFKVCVSCTNTKSIDKFKGNMKTCIECSTKDRQRAKDKLNVEVTDNEKVCKGCKLVKPINDFLE